jgi:TonB family protein
MKILTLILFLVITKIGFAQQDTTLIYNSPMYTKDPIRSKWRPVVKHVGQFYQVTFYDRKDVMQEVISFEDKDLTVRKGPFTSYSKGKLREKGDYDKGHKHGEWTTYNNADQIRKVENYVHGKLNGKSVEYWDGKQIQKEGAYENDRKIGEWNLYYSDAKLAGKEVYDVYGKKGQAEYFYKDGKPATYDDLFAPPTYKGGINQFYKHLAGEIKYPLQLAKDGVQGTVKLSFIVKKNGDLDNVEVVESPHHELSIEAARVLKSAPDWIPGKMFGEVVETRYTVPIKFSLRK